ncbi:hypothetical protein GUITHDRAFT_122772 [Guillardia theta CCMP2712]|uniref:Uncharacterized protein n=2 Tax=Guillardia theta TaxID=55529 RepID=L1I4K5_GUITC|nr:hypothetical protein GUITHDRAFT_122772 [Guillardia theta CCMP2712]EKX31022.1 hypothetical protein GUITHDRAFT_122772 [Guillardia theta CCMP2712]|eukprot:XP_005818002.1 hypothetical protein GUITHDRAFT_122772 [Guillardia theta CCMP2712]
MSGQSVNRTLIVLVCGNDSDEVYENNEVEVEDKKNFQGKVLLQLQRSRWSALLEAALEYARVVNELRPQGSAVSIMLCGYSGYSKEVSIVQLNKWNAEQQNMAYIYGAISSSKIVKSEETISGDDIAREALKALVSDLDHEEVGTLQARVLLISSPAALRCPQGSSMKLDGAIESAFTKAKNHSACAEESDVRLEMLWVLESESSEKVMSTSTSSSLSSNVVASSLRSRVYRLAAAHFNLQIVRITGIPMRKKDTEADKTKDVKGSSKKEYDVELLSFAEVGDVAELVLEWKSIKQLEKIGFNIHAHSSRTIHRSTALKPKEEATQTILTHIRGGAPATLVLAGSSSSLPSPFSSSSPSACPSRVWVLRDQEGGIFLHELLIGGLLEDSSPSCSTVAAIPDALQPDKFDGDTLKAFQERMAEMLRGSLLPLTAKDVKNLEEAGFLCKDVTVPFPVPYVTTAAIERRTRYLPLGSTYSPLYSGSSSSERAVRSTVSQARGQGGHAGELVVGKGGEITAPKKEKIRGLKELVETCISQSAPEDMIAVANKTIDTVSSYLAKAETAGNVSGWTLHELKTLWEEISVLGGKCAMPPSSKCHFRVTRHLSTKGVAVANEVEEEIYEPKLGDKRKAAVEVAQPKQARSRRKHDIPVDEHGRPELPIQLGNAMTIESLGHIKADNPNFHTDKYIWPVGYRARRQYQSTLEVDKKVDYICEILDAGPKPTFQITPTDNPAGKEVAATASGVWSAIMKKVNNMRLQRGLCESKTAVSGPEYYGIAYPEVRRLIQELPGAIKCATKPYGNGCYKWQHFGDETPAMLEARSAREGKTADVAKGGGGGGGGGGAVVHEEDSSDEAKAWSAFDSLTTSRQAGGRTGAGIDNPLLEGGLELQGDVADDRAVLLNRADRDSVFFVYWKSWLLEDKHTPKEFARFYDPSRHTGRN